MYTTVHKVQDQIFCVQYGMVRYRVGEYGIFQVLRKKTLKTIIIARWEKDDFFFFFFFIES